MMENFEGFFGKSYQYFAVAGLWFLVFFAFIYSGFKGRTE